MNGRVLTGAAAAILAVALAAGVPPIAGPAPAAAAARDEVPCPRNWPNPLPKRPPRPVPPPDDPVLKAVGGTALQTDGLIVPAGVKAPPALPATSWLVADLDTGAVLGGCGPHVYGTPASVQKLLLAATVMAKLDPKQEITVTAADLDIEPGSSAVGLLVGGKYTIETLWLGLILNSGNEAANALARLGGGAGGLPATMTAMNAKAKELGAFQTHAVTPSGLDAEGQFTSAYDLALIARECFANPDFGRYALTRSTQIPAQAALKKGGFQIQNENKLIFQYDGALGGKTGFTDLARHTYVGAAERNGRRLVATVLGAEPRPLRGWQQGAALLDWGFSLPTDAKVGDLVAPGTEEPAGADATPGPPGVAQAAPPATARTPSPPSALSTGIAAAVAVTLAAAPIALLINARRRRLRLRSLRRRA
jgi:D-alanyl-D-alanine carboxypeptidase (penicillin-binding protein 5/6)